MARPLRAAAGTTSGASHGDRARVYATVIVPALVATWLVSTVMWAWARDRLTSERRGPGWTPRWRCAGLRRRVDGRSRRRLQVAAIGRGLSQTRALRGTCASIRRRSGAGGQRRRGRVARHVPHGAGDARAGVRPRGRGAVVAGRAAGVSDRASCLMLAVSAHIGSGRRCHVGRDARVVGTGRRRAAADLARPDRRRRCWPCVGPHIFDLHAPAWRPGSIMHEISVEDGARVRRGPCSPATGVLAGRSQQTGTGRRQPPARTGGPGRRRWCSCSATCSSSRRFMHRAVPQCRRSRPGGDGIPRPSRCARSKRTCRRGRQRPAAGPTCSRPDRRRGGAAADGTPGCRRAAPCARGAAGGASAGCC